MLIMRIVYGTNRSIVLMERLPGLFTKTLCHKWLKIFVQKFHGANGLILPLMIKIAETLKIDITPKTMTNYPPFWCSGKVCFSFSGHINSVTVFQTIKVEIIFFRNDKSIPKMDPIGYETTCNRKKSSMMFQFYERVP